MLRPSKNGLQASPQGLQHRVYGLKISFEGLKHRLEELKQGVEGLERRAQAGASVPEDHPGGGPADDGGPEHRLRWSGNRQNHPKQGSFNLPDRKTVL
jgi:hypothetical protein